MEQNIEDIINMQALPEHVAIIMDGNRRWAKKNNLSTPQGHKEGAENLKTITVKGNLKSIGKNAFVGINKKAIFKIKATESNYKKIVNKIKKAGAPKTATYKRIK